MSTTRTPRKRANGEGSIRFDERTGLWVGALSVPVGGGRSRRRFIRAKRQADLMAKMHAARAEASAPARARAGRCTTGQWLQTWLTDILPGTVAASTEAHYAQVVRDWVVPHVGDKPLAGLAAEDVDRMVQRLAGAGRAVGTQRLARTVLRRALSKAVRYGHVPHNVAALTDPPTGGVTVVDPLTAAEAGQVLSAATGDRLEALAVVVLNLGLRQGEALDLRWDDVDLKAAELTVRGTKTEASRRVVPMPPSVVEALHRHRARQLAERVASSYWHDAELVFPTPAGTRYDKRSIIRWWHELTIKAGVGRRRFHASRHTAATLMLNAGVPLETVSKVLGHSSYAITADVYAKPGAAMLRGAADAMERVLGRER